MKLPVVKSGSKVYQVANVSRCMTADGQQVIIVVQRPSDDRAPAAPTVAANPAPIPTLRKPAPAVKLLPKQPQAYSSGDEGDDPSWTPSPVSTQVPPIQLFFQYVFGHRIADAFPQLSSSISSWVLDKLFENVHLAKTAKTLPTVPFDLKLNENCYHSYPFSFIGNRL